MKIIVALTPQRIILILAIASVAAVPAVATEGNWKPDAGHSTAQILLGGNVFNIGVVRLGGNIELDTAGPTNSILDLSIDPAGGKLITFEARRAKMSPAGKLEVSGDLTLNRVLREVILNPTEDYSGPVYGEPMMQTVTHEVTFVFPMSDQKEGEITGEAKMFRENFPELFAAVTDTNWQPAIQDKACELPPAGEDYAGAICTGTVFDPNRSAAVASIGEEDYHGCESAAPEGNLMTIVLKLRLTQEDRGQAMGSD
jgi:hypothetical protein